jgi:hypothetical protein
MAAMGGERTLTLRLTVETKEREHQATECAKRLECNARPEQDWLVRLLNEAAMPAILPSPEIPDGANYEPNANDEANQTEHDFTRGTGHKNFMTSEPDVGNGWKADIRRIAAACLLSNSFFLA